MRKNSDSDNSSESPFLFIRGELDVNNPRHIKKLRDLRNLSISRIRQYYTSWWGGASVAKPKIVPLDAPTPEHRKVVSWVESLLISGETEKGKIRRYNCGYFSPETLKKLEDIAEGVNENETHPLKVYCLIKSANSLVGGLIQAA